MKTGVIGLGTMGASMAVNFHKAGHLHRIWNRTASKAEELAKQTNVILAESPEQLAANCDLIVTCVSRDQDVIEMIEKIAMSINAGSIVVDTSTVGSNTAKQAAEILFKQSAHFLDCPVSGGSEGAKNGTLVMMVGGDAVVLTKAKPTLEAIASNIVYIGPTGSGQACKAVNQVLCAGINQAVTEALNFGEKLQLDMNKVINVVSKGAAGNWFLEHRGRTMLAGSFPPGFKVNLHHKDLNICKDMSSSVPGLELPLVEMTLKHYQTLISKDYGEEDISSLFRIKHKN